MFSTKNILAYTPTNTNTNSSPVTSRNSFTAFITRCFFSTNTKKTAILSAVARHITISPLVSRVTGFYSGLPSLRDIFAVTRGEQKRVCSFWPLSGVFSIVAYLIYNLYPFRHEILFAPEWEVPGMLWVLIALVTALFFSCSVVRWSSSDPVHHLAHIYFTGLWAVLLEYTYAPFMLLAKRLQLQPYTNGTFNDVVIDSPALRWRASWTHLDCLNAVNARVIEEIALLPTHIEFKAKLRARMDDHIPTIAKLWGGADAEAANNALVSTLHAEFDALELTQKSRSYWGMVCDTLHHVSPAAADFVQQHPALCAGVAGVALLATGGITCYCGLKTITVVGPLATVLTKHAVDIQHNTALTKYNIALTEHNIALIQKNTSIMRNQFSLIWENTGKLAEFEALLQYLTCLVRIDPLELPILGAIIRFTLDYWPLF
jgi:hypothetical protein